MSKLSVQEAAYGWTHELVIDYSDLTETTNDTAQEFTIAIPAGAVVKQVGHKLVTTFDGAGAALSLAAGDDADADGYLAATEVHEDGTVVTYSCNTGDLVDGTTSNQKTYTAADTIDITLTPSGGYALASLTSGQVRILAQVAEL